MFRFVFVFLENFIWGYFHLLKEMKKCIGGIGITYFYFSKLFNNMENIYNLAYYF